MSAQQHEQARYYLHIGHDQLNRREQAALDTHLAECAVCRAYATDLAGNQERLVRAMDVRWGRYSPSPDLGARVSTRLQRRIRQRQVVNLVGATVEGAPVVLIIVLGWVLVRQAQWSPVVPASPPATATPQPPPPATDDGGWAALPGLATFGDELKLLDFALPASSLPPGATAEMVLYWQTPTDNPAFMVFAHLLDADGRPVVQVDAPLSDGACSAGIAATCLSIPLPEQLAPGPYQLVVGVYDEDSGQRLTTETGQAELALATIQISPLPIESLPSSPTPFPKPPSCPVTLANGSTPPGEEPIPDHHGNGAIWTTLWPEGKVLIPPHWVRPDGSLTVE